MLTQLVFKSPRNRILKCLNLLEIEFLNVITVIIRPSKSDSLLFKPKFILLGFSSIEPFFVKMQVPKIEIKYLFE